MSQILLKRPHGLTRKKAIRLVDQLREELSEEHEFEGEWEDGVLHLHRTGATGEVHVHDDDIEIKVKLALMLKPLRRTIEQRIEEQLDAFFPPA